MSGGKFALGRSESEGPGGIPPDNSGQCSRSGEDLSI